jgi:epoxyqueuosine reductase
MISEDKFFMSKHIINKSLEFGLKQLPSRSGWYNHFQCNVQMEKDIKNARSVIIKNGKSKSQEVRYCRRCEIACPIGKS